MVSRETTYSGILGELQRLSAALLANSGDLQFLEASRARFTTVLGQALEVSKTQAALVASKQDSSQQLKALVNEAQRLATVLRLAVKQHYGIRAEKLAEFNMQPFRGRTKKATTPATPAAPTPTPHPTTPAQ